MTAMSDRGGTRPIAPREAVLVAAILGLYVAFHAQFLVPSFGEADAARLAMDALGWHLGGTISLAATDYRMRTSPLYIHALKCMMGGGVPLRDLPRLMAWTSLLSSAAGLAAAYGLFRSLVGRTRSAIACGLLAATPAYWMGAHYGMAHVPALALLLLALGAFSRALDGESAPRGSLGWLGASLGLFFVALCLKADFVLTGLAFPGLAWVRRKRGLPFAAAGVAIVLIGLLGQFLYVKGVVTTPSDSHAVSTIRYAESWHSRFPFDRRALFAKWGGGSIPHASGPLLFVVMLAALLANLVNPRRRRLALWAAAASLPVILFWGLIFANSARHNLSALPPLALLVGTLLVDITRSRFKALAVALAVAIGAANYVSETRGDPAGNGGMLPRSNLVQLGLDQVKYSDGDWRWARQIAGARATKKAVVGRYSRPYAAFELAAENQGTSRLEYDGKELLIVRDGRVAQRLLLADATSLADARAVAAGLRAEGYAVWIRDFMR